MARAHPLLSAIEMSLESGYPGTKLLVFGRRPEQAQMVSRAVVTCGILPRSWFASVLLLKLLLNEPSRSLSWMGFRTIQNIHVSGSVFRAILCACPPSSVNSSALISELYILPGIGNEIGINTDSFFSIGFLSILRKCAQG